MDPKQKVKFGPWEDKKPTDRNFRRIVVFADGSKGWEIYEYGTDGPVSTVPDQDLGVDLEVKSQYDEYIKKNTPVRTDVKYNPPAGQPGHDPNLPVGTAIKTATPEGGTTQVVGTEAPRPSASAESKPPTERVNPADPTKRERWDPTANNGAGAWVEAGTVYQKPEDAKPPQERVNPADPTKRQVWNPSANDGKGAWEDAGAVYQKPEESRPPQERVDPANPGRRQVWKDGQWQDAGAVYQKPDPPTMIGGKPHRLNPTTGNYEPIKIEGAGDSRPQISPDDPRLGEIASNLRQKANTLAQMVGKPRDDGSVYTLDDYKRDLTTEVEISRAKRDELVGIASEQRGIQQSERTEGASRRSWADQAFKNAASITGPPSTHVVGPNAGKNYVGAMKYWLDQQKVFAQGIPGAFPDTSRTPLQNEIMSIGMNADGSVTLRPTGGAAAGGMGAAPPPDFASTMAAGVPGLPGGPGAGVGPGGENLTRPGFSEGMQGWDPSGVLDGVFDPNDPTDSEAVGRVFADFGIG